MQCKEKFGSNLEEKLYVSSNGTQRNGFSKKIFDVKMITGYGEMLEGDGIISVGWISEKDMPFLFNYVYSHTSEKGLVCHFRGDGLWKP